MQTVGSLTLIFGILGACLTIFSMILSYVKKAQKDDNSKDELEKELAKTLNYLESHGEISNDRNIDILESIHRKIEETQLEILNIKENTQVNEDFFNDERLKDLEENQQELHILNNEVQARFSPMTKYQTVKKVPPVGTFLI